MRLNPINNPEANTVQLNDKSHSSKVYTLNRRNIEMLESLNKDSSQQQNPFSNEPVLARKQININSKNLNYLES
jgi:hypothetical protein